MIAGNPLGLSGEVRDGPVDLMTGTFRRHSSPQHTDHGAAGLEPEPG